MAVKVQELLNCKGSRMREQLDMLHQELGMYKRLSGHKHVVGFLDSHLDERSSTLYIFLEYVPGGSIASLLRRFGRLNEDVVRIYTSQVGPGMGLCEREGGRGWVWVGGGWVVVG
jgi:serine/threonine protein kinase